MNTEREERNIEAPGVQELSNKLLHIYANGDMDDVAIFILKCKRDYDRAAIGPKDELIDHKEKEISALKDELDSLTQENARLRDALDKYGHHFVECISREANPFNYEFKKCDCGYEQALKSPHDGKETR